MDRRKRGLARGACLSPLSPTVIRIDTTGTGNFAKAVTIKVQVRKYTSGTTYGYLAPRTVQAAIGGKAVPVTVSGHFHGGSDPLRGGAGISVAAEGTCKFGKTTRKVRITDTNGNLSLSDVAKPPFSSLSYRSGDMISLANEDGVFTSVTTAPILLGQPVQVDGAWYIVSVDGMKASATKCAAGTARITVKADQWQCTLAGEKYFLTVSGGKAPVDVPADTYRVMRYRLTMKGEAGKPGPMMYGYESKSPVELEAGKTTPLAIGAPILAKMSATRNGENVVFSLTQTDAAGSRIGTVLIAGGKRPPNPKIDVLTREGSIVYTAKLEYG